ncbi:MAG: hypothetical protein RLZZ522_937 [Verrucomicrobiota bacterium]|jgi:hypothetical protein
MKATQHFIPVILTSSLLSLGLQAAPQAPEPTAPAAVTQKTFDTPEQAAACLVQAAAAFEVPALKAILGPDGDDLIASEDPVMDKERAAAFAAMALEKQGIEIDPDNPNQAVISVGEDDFPLPIPLVKTADKWSFDTKAGAQEVLLRRIGANELDVIEICKGFVEAQHEYAQTKHDGAIVNQYAQRIISTPEKQDGLAWKNADGSWDGPVGEHIAKALEQGYAKDTKAQPFHGYHFKVLKGQGPAAPLGELDFLVGGAMIGGFALAAAPAQYKVTGVKTFIISHTGVVYEKDLGAETLDLFEKMNRYDPDNTWEPTADQWEE